MSAQYFNWAATGMRFASERKPHGPMQYVRADEHDKLLHEVGRLKAAVEQQAKIIDAHEEAAVERGWPFNP